MTSARELDRRPSAEYYDNYSRDSDHNLDDWLQQRSENGRLNLAINLALLNLAALLCSSVFSYAMARKTLRPIEDAMAAQERFIADASHELRTPLTSLLLNNEVALRKHSLTVPAANEVILRNVDDLKQLKTLSDNLLDLAVQKPTAVTIKTISLDVVVDAAIAQVMPIASEKSVAFQNNVSSVSIAVDDGRLSKLLVILFDNAVKYSHPHKIVMVDCEPKEKEVVLMVRDEGIGMSKQDALRVFDRFYRADQSRSHVSGHGLGLSIALKLAHELGGSLDLETDLGKGSTFLIHLPK
jgi:signal transduction histidine kinase